MSTLHSGHVRLLALSGRWLREGKALNDAGLDAVWRSVDAVKAAQEDPIADAFAALLARQRRAVLGAWAGVGPGQVGQTEKRKPQDAVVGSLVFDVGAWAAEVAAEFGPLAEAVLQEGFRTGLVRVGATDVRFRLTPRASDELERVLGLLKGTSETTRDALGGIIRRGMEAGESVDEIAAAIGRQFTEWEAWRARTVAQSTVNPTFAVGQQEAFTEAGVGYNAWLTQRDDRVRQEHAGLDGETVKVGENFSNGQAYPQDVNCRCDLLPVLKDEPEKSAGRAWRRERDARMRARYEAEKGAYPLWSDLVQKIADDERIAFDTARKVVHARR